MASGATAIAVDVHALGILRTKLTITADALKDDHGAFGGDDMGIEHRGLRHALDDFDSRWSIKRHKAQENVEAAEKAIGKVQDSFTNADQQLADAVSGAATNSPNSAEA